MVIIKLFIIDRKFICTARIATVNRAYLTYINTDLTDSIGSVTTTNYIFVYQKNILYYTLQTENTITNVFTTAFTIFTGAILKRTLLFNIEFFVS